MDAQRDRIGVELARRVAAESDVRRTLELDPDLGHPLGQPLARTDVERHVRPAPVVHVQPERGERLRERSRRDVLLVAITWHVLAQHPAFRILPPDRRAGHLFVADRPDRAQNLHLLVAHGVGFERQRRLHRDEREQLQRVILHDVAQGARLVVVRAPALDTDLLRHGDLHRIDKVRRPHRLEDRVGETKRQDVLHRLLAEVVVDPVDLILLEDALENARQLARRFEI